MPRRRLAAAAALAALALAGMTAWWLQPRPPTEASAQVAALATAAAVFRPGLDRPPSVTLPPLPAIDAVRVDKAASGAALRAGMFEVCGVGTVPGQWQRPWPEADEMAFELPAALAVDAPNAALDQLVHSLQRSSRPRAGAAALMMQREGDAGHALAQMAAASHDPVVAHWALAACLAADPTNRTRCAALARRWAQLDPDNAVAWLAVIDGEPGAAAEAMQRVALASRFDEHFGEVVREASQAVRAEWTPYLRLQVLNHAFIADTKGLVSYSPLLQHCAAAQLADPDRRQRCEAITELMVGRGGTLLAQKVALVFAKRLNWPEHRMAPLRAAHARADEALRAAAERSRQHGAHGCATVEADLRHLQAALRGGEWAAFSEPGR